MRSTKGNPYVYLMKPIRFDNKSTLSPVGMIRIMTSDTSQVIAFLRSSILGDHFTICEPLSNRVDINVCPGFDIDLVHAMLDCQLEDMRCQFADETIEANYASIKEDTLIFKGGGSQITKKIPARIPVKVSGQVRVTWRLEAEDKLVLVS